jgi:hypothetical protein
MSRGGTDRFGSRHNGTDNLNFAILNELKPRCGGGRSIRASRTSGELGDDRSTIG